MLKPRKVNLTGVFGYPIKHTLSPVMHNSAFKALRMPYIYLPFCVKPKECRKLLKLLPALGFKGVNITVPHKKTAFDSVDYLTAEAKIAGAVNTIKVSDNKLFGTSTDGEGLVRSLKEDAGFNIKGKNIIILGAGGAGRSAALYLAVKGVKRIVIANRTKSRALLIVKMIKKQAPGVEAIAIPLKDSEVWKYVCSSGLIINATSIGLNSSDKPILSSNVFRKGIIFYDMIYNPALTSNMKTAKKGGAICFSGIGMLLHQGAISFRFWTGKIPPLKVMKKALLKELKKR